MTEIRFHQALLSFFLLGILTACTTSNQTKKVDCTANVMEANGRPCWVNIKPTHGIVVNMTKHVKPEKTREILFKSALTELSVTQNGVGIAQDAVVKKVVEERNNSHTGHTSMTSLSVITTAKESKAVKARIEAVWNDYATQKLYMWVILEDY
ncbi:MAG: hypothetical protein PSN04_00700 [Methyloprofundus sp.]|nr:hypothetical protein [Methyloprofundus sp.]